MRKADNLPPFCAVVVKSGSLNFLEPSGPVMGPLYLFTATIPVIHLSAATMPVIHFPTATIPVIRFPTATIPAVHFPTATIPAIQLGTP